MKRLRIAGKSVPYDRHHRRNVNIASYMPISQINEHARPTGDGDLLSVGVVLVDFDKPKFHYADFPETFPDGAVSGKSA